MPNTTYDRNYKKGGVNSLFDSTESDSQSGARSELLGSRGGYKKYSIKDYQNLQMALRNQKVQRGLGPNIGGEEWEIAKRKKEI